MKHIPHISPRAWKLLLITLLVNTAYIAAFAHASVVYMGNVLLHLVIGVAVALTGFRLLGRQAGNSHLVLLLLCAVTGLALIVLGNTFSNRWLLWLHIGISLLFVASLAVWIRNRSFGLVLILLITFPFLTEFRRRVMPNPNDRIRNPAVIPLRMEEEGSGPGSPFWPSASRTNVGGTIPSNFFMDSKLCGECHRDIYKQWESSMHHFASFNNQFYRKSIEYMQEIRGTQASKWCAGCHDHAVFFNGRFDRPIKEQIDTPEAQNGLGCLSCHSIIHVDGSVGNGGFTIEYPPLHELASSRNLLIRTMDNFLTYVDPEPHRKTFMKPFMRLDSSEFCSSCHKVHLDIPVNGYRWLRGFNDYDNWQASGVSGQGARSFYYPEKPSTCSGCHMPLVRSRDPGNRNGYVHSHRFAAANMAVAYANQDTEQIKEVERNLTSGFVSVDIFAASPVESTPGHPDMQRRRMEGPALASTFAVGEEAEQTGQMLLREVSKLAAPLNAEGYRFRAGQTVRVDVVVRTRRIGHFFPGGTVDAFDVWLELEGRDATGMPVFWSGRVADDGKGPVEPGAHFYRSYQLDAEGNPINKRNAWQTRSVLYVRLIPPGAADVAHFRVRIPPHARGPITLHARLNYRKFSHYYTQFAYSGEPAPNQDTALVSASHDSRRFTFGPQNIPKNVSGRIRDRIPDVPTVTLARAETVLEVADDVETQWRPVPRKQDRERWNDWGIGLLLQGDLKGAEYAFTRVTEIDPAYADGWLNVARALIQEGETERAKPFIERALQIDGSLARVHFFKALIQKADGDYDGALESLRIVRRAYPRDRVNLNQIARILFLKRDYRAAIDTARGVLSVDPEDVQAHYTLMLSYRGTGDTTNASRQEKLFRRFKADESSQALTAKIRMLSPEDNNERQMIHDHDSALLP
jgi:tetratricopeptide (TPR) repeat protein